MMITRKAQTGEPGNKGQFGRKAPSGAEASLGRPRPEPVNAYDIVPGDEIWRGEQLLGIAEFIDSYPNHVVVSFLTQARGYAVATNPVYVVRTTMPFPYDTSSSRTDRLHAARDPRQSADTVAFIASRETEVDFLKAVAAHPNASRKSLDLVSKDLSFTVRREVVENPNTTDRTVERLRVEAREGARSAIKRLGDHVNDPRTNKDAWTAKQNYLIANAAKSRLAG